MKNVKDYAARHYSNSGGNSAEFISDMDRIKYIQRYINNRYKLKKVQTLQIINILIMLTNLFDLSALIEILKKKVKVEFLPETWSYMMFLGMPACKKLAYNKILLEKIPHEYKTGKGL